MSARLNQKGFAPLIVLVIGAVILVGIGYYLGHRNLKVETVQVPNQPIVQTSQETATPDVRQQWGNCTVDECLFLKSSNSTIYGYTKVSGYYKSVKGSDGPSQVDCDALVVTNSNSEFAKYFIDQTKKNNNPPMLDSNGNLIFVVNLDEIDPKFKQLIQNSKSGSPVQVILGIPEVMRSMDAPGCYSPGKVLSAS